MPETFGRYELQELLGRGGMGEVYRAYDSVRDREVALKLLPPHLAADEAFQARFRRESRLAARLNDPHIIPIHDFGEIDGRLFLDMRLVKGHDLSSTLQTRGALPLETAVGIVSQVASALDAAHESGLIHRDVKPSNILLTGSDDANPFAYLVDFGIARSAAQEGTALTATTATLGTVAYLSPERINGSPGDKRTDVYALACVLFETLAGHKPFDGEMFAMMYSHVNTPPPSVTADLPGCPPAMDAVIARGMAKNPDDRYPTAGALARDARAALRSAAPSSAPPQPATPPEPSTDRLPRSAPQPSGPYLPSGPYPSPPSYLSGPYQPGPYQPGPPQSEAYQSEAYQSGPRQAGPYGTGAYSSADPSSVHPAGSLPPQRPPTGPGPVRPLNPDESRGTSSSRLRVVLAVVAAVVILAGGVTALVLTRGDNRTTADPGPTDSSSISHSPDFPSGSAAGPSAGSSAAPLNNAIGTQVDWKDFSSFSALLGRSNSDTTHAYGGASCTITKATKDDIDGVVERVGCTVPNTSAIVSVSRFKDVPTVRTYLDRLQIESQFSALPWGQQGKARGVAYSSSAGDGVPNITTTVCAMPTYLIQMYSSGSRALAVDRIRADVWDKATFPDVIPPECAADLDGPVSDGKTSTGITAEKPPIAFTATTLKVFLTRHNPMLDTATAAKGGDLEAIAYDQTGHVDFWGATPDRGVVRVGSSTYPYDKSIGPADARVPAAAYLSGMSHATFVLTGTFTTDGAGNAVAFARAKNGDWGTIKAKSNGNLAPSGKPIASNRIGLSQGFDLSKGQLVTFDCSAQLPIAQCSGTNRVIKYWKWNSTEFVQVGSAGRSS